MCAIAGILGLTSSRKIHEKMLRTMHRRGPDGNGVYQKGICTLLHARLAIIDPEGGKQPMELRQGEREYCIVYNGELYNTAELRYELEKQGHDFYTHSDTEVVLHAYAQWEEDCVGKLNGIFAFAVWDACRERLFLARDRIGVKPLFYTQRGEGLIFGSEIKTILAHADVKPQLDAQGAAEILLLGPGRTPGSGVFYGIRELEPGCFGRFENGRLKICRYWALRDREHRENFEETAECVRYLVTDAIKRQMVSDVPIGTFLSGGLDSSLITAICAGDMQEKGEQLKTFSVDYEHNERFFRANKFQPNADGEFIDLMQDFLGTDHKKTVLTAEELVGGLDEAVLARDLPGMADVDASLLLFCRKIREDVKVALSGECADEIFGGYPWYRDPQVRAASGFPWAQSSLQRISLLSPGIRERLDAAEFIHSRYEQTCRESDILPEASREERRMKEMVNLNFRWFMQTLLDRKDRMSMYSGLEVRVPFCDYRIAEYLYGVPWEYKDHQGKEKGLLRTAMEGILPEKVLWRKKSPYPKTFDPVYTELVEGRLRRILQDKNAPILHILNASEAGTLWNAEGPWPWYGQLMKGPQTMAYLIQVDFWLRQYGIDFLF